VAPRAPCPKTGMGPTRGPTLSVVSSPSVVAFGDQGPVSVFASCGACVPAPAVLVDAPGPFRPLERPGPDVPSSLLPCGRLLSGAVQAVEAHPDQLDSWLPSAGAATTLHPRARRRRAAGPRLVSVETTGVLSDSSHGVRLGFRPSVDIRCVRPLPTRCRPRPGGVPSGLGMRCIRACALRHRRGFAASLRSRLASPGRVPPMPFLTTSTACSARAAQACCILQPTMGFAWLQAAAGS
jgi:hypothetical protein